jgi:hypothetical protein
MTPEPKAHTTPGDKERKQRILANGLECLRRLHGDQTWEDWMGTGEAMMVLTEDALAAVGATAWDKDNKKLVKEFNRRWDEYEAGAGSNQKPLSKQERASLRFVMTNPEVGAFRAGLMGPDKRRLNHPNAVINRWRFSQRASVTRPSSPKRVEPEIDHNSLAKELAQAKARIAELEAALRDATKPSGPAQRDAEIAELKAALKEAQAARKPPVQEPLRSDGVQDENTRLKARIAALEADAKRSRFSGQGYIVPKKQFANLRLCVHPDTIAFLEAAVKDHPALQPKVESLTEQFAKAAMTLTEFKDVLVNEAAEEKGKRSDAFWAAARWKREEELRKKAAAKREARSAAAKQRAASKRAAQK